MRTRRASAALLLTFALGCGRDEILHGLDEAQANQVVVALSDAGIPAVTRRDDGSETSWRVEVGRGDATAAQRLLADRGLPRRAQPGFGDVFGKGSIVPTPGEERALYLHALCGELARTLEAIDGVIEARVHLAIAPQDPLRSDPAPPARAAVLLKAAAGARPHLVQLTPGIQSLVSGAVAGLEAGAVSVVIAESNLAQRARASPHEPRRIGLITLAILLATVALAAPAALLVRRRGRLPARLAGLVGGREPAA